MGVPLAQASRRTRRLDDHASLHEVAGLMVGVPISRVGASARKKKNKFETTSFPVEAAGMPLWRCSQRYLLQAEPLRNSQTADHRTIHGITSPTRIIGSLPAAAAAVGVTGIIGVGAGGALVAKTTSVTMTMVSVMTAITVGAIAAL